MLNWIGSTTMSQMSKVMKCCQLLNRVKVFKIVGKINDKNKEKMEI